MNDMESMNLFYWFVAATPVIVLLGCILLFHWESFKVGAVAWFVGIFAAWFFFKADARLMALANAKGIALSLYVLLIVWSAVFLYNVAEAAGAVKVISGVMRKISDDRTVQCLLLSWCFSALLQGIAGFGVPVAIVAPIMAEMGFDPIVSVAACLVGHSWSISFGSMGSSYNAIQLVTGLPGEAIGPAMSLLFSAAVFSTGFSVLHIYGGTAAMKKGAVPVFAVGSLMSFMLWFMNKIGMAQISTLAAGMSGCFLLSVVSLMKKSRAGKIPAEREGEMSFHTAASPYYAVIALTLLSQVPAVKSTLSPYYWGLDFPSVSTALGYTVDAAPSYAKIQFFSHPMLILVAAALFGVVLYPARGKCAYSPAELLRTAVKRTAAKCLPMSAGITTLVMMALIMTDSGMTGYIARGIAETFGSLYPLASPFIGALGTFITGSNTNSNVMFGRMQYEAAVTLGKSAVLMSASQSVGGSLSVSISPSTIMTGAANVGSGPGGENKIMAMTIRYWFLNVSLVGFIVWLFGRQ
ncbi:MAG: L-lactate permease [Synergistaceae bacterium]|jgi:lactate permease|nr:L-lactate permease [Synergistaceae bacterium]